jgi:glycosyltransferase involved in cell wall biosynthesis
MRVAMVSEHASPLVAMLGSVDAGGQNVFVADLARALARRGVEVTVYTRRDDPGLPPRVPMSPGVVVEHVSAGPPEPVFRDLLLPHMDEFARRLRSAWARRRPDLVHAHFWMSGRASLAAAAPFGLPVVQTFHALGVVKRRHQGSKDTSPRERTFEELMIIKEADRILATSSDELFELVRLGADRHRVSVIPCGVDLDVFCPQGPTLPRRPGFHRVVVVSRLVERKGVGNVISALAAVPCCELVVAGGPRRELLDCDEEVRRFRQLAEAAGVADRVHFLGAIDHLQVPSLLRSADLVACVPWYEPFGMVALEAMACGVPVVASAVGGLVDTVVDGVTGVHVPPRRPDEVASAVRTLLAQPDVRAAMGAAGLQRARRRYGWDAIAQATLAAYGAVQEERAGRAADGQG